MAKAKKWELLGFDYGQTYHVRGMDGIECRRITIGTPYSLSDAAELSDVEDLVAEALGAFLGDARAVPAKKTRERVRNDWQHKHDHFNFAYSIRNGRWVFSFNDKGGLEPLEVVEELRRLDS